MASRLTYAIGDIHGRFDLLEMAIETVRRDAAARGRTARFVLLGDYVDRGPDSRKVIETLMALEDPDTFICLKGNHEELMLEGLTHARPGAYAHWCANGGRETLASYGSDGSGDVIKDVPARHILWLTDLPLFARDPHRVYVHAGLSPGKPLEAQSEAACLWIREKFLRAPARDFDQHVVHGHTPRWEGKPAADKPELLAHRSNLDTAAYATGVLTVGVFDEALPGGPIDVLFMRGKAAARQDDDIVDEPPRPRRPSLLRRLAARLNVLAD